MKEKCITFLKKTSYLVEGILSLLLAICTYQVLTIKYYQAYWSKGYLFLTFLLGIGVIGYMVYHCKNSNKQLEKLFLTFMLPVGFFYMIFMLPTYAPDESGHIWRIYEISQGNILTKQDEEGNTMGVDIPQTLIDAKQEDLNTYQALNDLWEKGTDYEETAHVISPAQGYSIVLYLPAVIVFLIVRICHIPILWGIYLAKICNFIVFLLGGYYAIRKIPFGKYIILTCLFLPMVLQQAVSLSADAMINVGIFVYIAYTIALLFQAEKITNKQKVMYSLLIAFIALAKMVYIPFIGLGFLLIFSKNMSKKDKIIIFGVGTVVCFAIVLVNYLYTTSLINPSAEAYYEAQNVNGTEQIKWMVREPMSFIKALKNTIDVEGYNYISGMIASPLGWMDIVVSPLIVLAFILLLFFSAMVEKNEVAFSKWQKVWSFILVIGTILLVITAMYISWTSVGAEITAGVQGRYFIPILPLLLLCLSMKENYIHIKSIHLTLPILLTILNAMVVHTIFEFFII